MWIFRAARICRYKDSCLLTRKGRPVIRTIKSCDWSSNTAERRECNRLDGPVLANTEDGMWVCVRKKVKMRQRERVRETCFNREDGGARCFFFFQERDDRWKEAWKKWETKSGEKNKTKEADIKRKRRLDELKWKGSAKETSLTCSQV